MASIHPIKILLIVILDLAFVVSACATGYIRYKEYRQARDYKTVLGQITRSEVLSKPDQSDLKIIYPPIINYEFFIDKRRYEGNQIRLFSPKQKTREYANELLSRYPRGRIVSVYYNPKNPYIAVLDLSYSMSSLYVMLILMAVNLAITIGVRFRRD